MQKIQSTVIVLNASRYNFTNEKTGEVMTGCKVYYIGSFDGSEQENSRGVDIAKVILPFEVFKDMINLPATYDFTFEISVNGKGQSVLKPVAWKFLEKFKK